MENQIYKSSGSDAASRDSTLPLVSLGNQSFPFSNSAAERLGASVAQFLPNLIITESGNLAFDPLKDPNVKEDLGPKKMTPNSVQGERRPEEPSGKRPEGSQKPPKQMFQKPPEGIVNVDEYVDGALDGLGTGCEPDTPLDVLVPFNNAIVRGTEKELVNDINAKLKRMESPYRVEHGDLGSGMHEIRLFKQNQSGQRELVDDCQFHVGEHLLK